MSGHPLVVLSVGVVFACSLGGCVDSSDSFVRGEGAEAVRHVLLAPVSAPAFGNLSNLPAWETAAESAQGKRDASDDFRKQHKEWYAQTRPPEKGQFRPFAEWEPMAEVWTTYTDGMVGSKAVRRMFAEQTIAFIRYGKPAVQTNILVGSAGAKSDFLKALDTYKITAAEKKHVVMVTLPHNTIWHIDYAGFPLIEKKTGRIAFADWIYYPARTLDDAVPTRLANSFYSATVYRMPMGFEGGNIQSDGVSVCATTNRSLENTGYSALKVSHLLSRYAGCEKTLVIKDISDDGTGHIDMFFKWVATDEVMLGRYEDSLLLDYDGDGKKELLPLPGSVAGDYAKTYALNKQRMDDNAALFSCLKSSKGTPYAVHRIPMMTRLKDKYGDLPRTFVNSTFSNKVNVYPSYSPKSCRDGSGAVCKIDADCKADRHCAAGRCTKGATAQGCDELVPCAAGLQCVVDPMKVALRALAQEQWTKAMPGWKHVGLRADTITLWSGAIHCITRNIPVGKIEKIVPDGSCSGGKCSGAQGGTVQSCSTSTQCTGPKWDCNCNVCQGKCKGGGICTDDADCSLNGQTFVIGACVYDDKQSCYGGSTSSSSCLGRCGKYIQDAICQCDSACAKYKDCCVDYLNLCTSGGDSPLTTCDAGSVDAGSPDSGAVDSGALDSGAPDAGSVDAGSVDVGSVDVGSVDVGSVDVGSVDAGSPDAGVVDAGEPGSDIQSLDGAGKDADLGDMGCVPQCVGKVCGADGCGGSCGQCLGGGLCTPQGLCVAPGTDLGGGAGGDGEVVGDASLVAGDAEPTVYTVYSTGSGGGSSCSAGRGDRHGSRSILWVVFVSLVLIRRWREPDGQRS